MEDKETHSSHTGFRQGARSLPDLLCFVLACLFPLAAGALLLRLVHMGGVPVWFLAVQGLIFAAALAQTVCLLAARLRARRQRKDGEPR